MYMDRVKVEWSGVSVPKPILDKIDELIRETGYWASKSSFASEAIREKLEREWAKLKQREQIAAA